MFEFTDEAFFLLNYDYELSKAQIWHNYFFGEKYWFVHPCIHLPHLANYHTHDQGQFLYKYNL